MSRGSRGSGSVICQQSGSGVAGPDEIVEKEVLGHFPLAVLDGEFVRH